MANWTLPGDDEEEPQTEASDEEDCETSPENEYFTELYDTVYAALEQGSRTEALSKTAAASYAFQAPSMTIAEAIEQGITVAGAGGNLQMAKLADRARLTHTARLVLSYVIEQKLSSRAGRALFTEGRRQWFFEGRRQWQKSQVIHYFVQAMNIYGCSQAMCLSIARFVGADTPVESWQGCGVKIPNLRNCLYIALKDYYYSALVEARHNTLNYLSNMLYQG